MSERTGTDLRGRVILVTGGSGGLGEGIVLRLARAGAKVGVGYHSGKDDADAVCRLVVEAGGEAEPTPGNVADEGDVADAFGRLLDRFGRVDGAVINAGLQADADVTDMTYDQWRKVMAVDLDGAFLTAREAMRRMPDEAPPGHRARGALVFVTSVHEFIPWAGHANYAAAKGGVDMLMRSLAQEGAKQGVRVNSVAPGAIRTPINQDVWSDEEKRRALLTLIPYGRLGESEDVANAVAWLMSDEADYVTGASLVVDGGMSLYPGFIGNG